MPLTCRETLQQIELGRQLAASRKTYSLTSRDAAALLNIPESYYRSLESGHSPLPDLALRRLLTLRLAPDDVQQRQGQL